MSGDLTHDLAVVGGGPAGVAGALTAALAGRRVVLLDSGPRLGGQYFRHAHGASPEPRFARQAHALLQRADVLLGHQVWALAREDDGLVVHTHTRAGRQEVRARNVLIATGAHDRPLPFPGWTLPGVLTAGGAQALLKGENVLAGKRVAVAGTGPFLLPVAAGLARAGAHVVGLFEASGGLGLARHPVMALGKAGEAAGYALALAAHRVPYRRNHAVVAAHGDDELRAVTVAGLDRDWNVLGTEEVACDALATGYGFVPQLELALQLGCRTRADADGTPVVEVDARQRTSVPGVWAAGEPTGVGGWTLAEIEGRIAGLAVAGAREVPGLLRRRARLRAFAAALQAAYPVKAGWQSWLTEDTLVCRCEEVPLARVREARELGATDARSIKLLARPGMGWCQGRMCGFALSCLAGETQQPPRRPIAQPITLGALAEPPQKER
ncbi:NAD(P)/FAD-dependent oxidoreductase [Nonomuraea typhae]|uniref:FAD/NAD(P)-dependent oxidoreductase n=1 Tax=Nonomuraea typhae TaxID=2603600 RepID=UPI001FE96A10|nr:FAD/NAD(P)-binding oxidoreductase [Nonomuraea typhae]